MTAAPTAAPAPVQDYPRALAEYVARWMLIPADRRAQLLDEQARRRKDHR